MNSYKQEKDYRVIEVGVKSCRQLFNEREPAPYRQWDLDEQFVNYILTAVEEFPLKTKMIIRILTANDSDLADENRAIVLRAIRNYFEYKSKHAKTHLYKRLRTARYFFLIGICTLFVSLTSAQFISRIESEAEISNIVSVGFVIIGWVAMWHPIEVLLYDWWPIREQRLYFDKIARLQFIVQKEQHKFDC